MYGHRLESLGIKFITDSISLKESSPPHPAWRKNKQTKKQTKENQTNIDLKLL